MSKNIKNLKKLKTYNIYIYIVYQLFYALHCICKYNAKIMIYFLQFLAP